MTVSRISRLISTHADEHLEVNGWSQFLSRTERFPGRWCKDAKRGISAFSARRSASSACCIVACTYKTRFLSINTDRYRELCAWTEHSAFRRPIIQRRASSSEHQPARLDSVLLRLAIATHFSLFRAKARASEWKWNFSESAHFCPLYNCRATEQGSLGDSLDDRWWPQTSCQPVLINAIVN